MFCSRGPPPDNMYGPPMDRYRYRDDYRGRPPRRPFHRDMDRDRDRISRSGGRYIINDENRPG